MKNVSFTVLITVIVLPSTCGGGASEMLPTIGNVDMQMLCDDAELEKVYDIVNIPPRALASKGGYYPRSDDCRRLFEVL